jgi:outer membrane protein TolC
MRELPFHCLKNRAARLVGGIVIALAALPGLAQQEPLTLRGAIDLALTRNERAMAADARSEAASSRVDRARAFFFPELELSGTYLQRGYESTRQIGDEVVTLQARDAQNTLSTLSWTLFDARAFPLFRQSKLLAEASRLDALQQRRLLAYEAAGAYLATLGFEAVSGAAERRQVFARESLDDARARFEAGLVSSNDVTRAELELANAELAASRASADFETARLNLADLLVTDLPATLVAPVEILDLAAQPPAADDVEIDAARERRYDLLALENTTAAQKEFAKEPMLRLVPTLDLSGSYRTTSDEGLSGRDYDSSASLVMTWTLFDGGEAFAERAERLALARAAEYDLGRATRAVSTDVRIARARLVSEQASIRQAAAAVSAARKNSTESSELYREGLATALERSDAAVQLFEAEVAEVRAKFSLAIAWLDLRDALGFDPLPEGAAPLASAEGTNE